ncbi:hypothetical protein DFJ63DRAFT_313220 [Scheffersomyces coipomensis]|uniref:uncharacterized protein n=1 Tax=Scheffersomyces coipomensis TaxID=1788519 RepID=UPI00315D4BB7
MSTILTTRRKTSKSRKGCLSCKKLRIKKALKLTVIKCDEAKPSCEYCVHTSRECIYPSPITIANLQYGPETSNSSTSTSSSNDSSPSELEKQQLTVTLQESTVLRRYQTDLMHQTELNNATSQLGISRFELRLLDFFNNFCIYELSNEPNDVIHSVWVTHVPQVFLQSELIRNSIYSYSALNLFPLCEDLHKLRIEDDIESRLKFKTRIGSISFISDDHRDVPESDDLYIKTAKYFMDTITAKNKFVDELKYNNITDLPTISIIEFTISSILILSFLGIHPHKIMPLVSFDQSESDLISICKAIRETGKMYDLRTNNIFKDLYTYDKFANIPSVKQSFFPTIMRLRDDLELEYKHSSTISEEYNILYDALELLQSGMFKGILYSHPAPLFRWIIIISDEFQQLIYKKCPFALRLLYIFSSLSILVRVLLFKDANLWVDYMQWYKSYNFDLVGSWKYSMDEAFYYLIFEKDFTLIGNSETNLMTFDAEFIAQVI